MDIEINKGLSLSNVSLVLFIFLGIMIITIYMMGMEQWRILDATRMFSVSNLKCQQESSETETFVKSYFLGPCHEF